MELPGYSPQWPLNNENGQARVLTSVNFGGHQHSRIFWLCAVMRGRFLLGFDKAPYPISCLTPGRSIDLPENVAQTLGDCTLAGMKTRAPGTAHSESTPNAFPTPPRNNRSKSAPPTKLWPGPSTRCSTQGLARPGPSGPSSTPTTRERSWQFFGIDHGTCKSIFLLQVIC